MEMDGGEGNREPPTEIQNILTEGKVIKRRNEVLHKRNLDLFSELTCGRMTSQDSGVGKFDAYKSALCDVTNGTIPLPGYLTTPPSRYSYCPPHSRLVFCLLPNKVSVLAGS